MNKSIVIASVIAVAALAACGKKETPVVVVPAPAPVEAPVVAPAPVEPPAAMPAPADAASTPGAATFGGTMPESGDAKTQADEAAAKAAADAAASNAATPAK